MKPSYIAHNYSYQTETVEVSESLPARVVNTQSHQIGMNGAEPLIVIADALVRYAKAYQTRLGGGIGEDYVLGDYFLSIAKSVKGLCDGDGAVAMETGRSTDSKDNSAVCKILETALDIGKFPKGALWE